MMDNFFWQDNENFIDDGIQIEPFNLSKEREEGYFDADGNFVEYVTAKEIKVKQCTELKLLNVISKLLFDYHIDLLQDAWLDSVEADIKYTGKTSAVTNGEDNNEDVAEDLSSQDIGMMKRRIANVLESGETVILHDYIRTL